MLSLVRLKLHKLVLRDPVKEPTLFSTHLSRIQTFLHNERLESLHARVCRDVWRHWTKGLHKLQGISERSRSPQSPLSLLLVIYNTLSATRRKREAMHPALAARTRACAAPCRSEGIALHD